MAQEAGEKAGQAEGEEVMTMPARARAYRTLSRSLNELVWLPVVLWRRHLKMSITRPTGRVPR